jgi:hypothetical protein
MARRGHTRQLTRARPRRSALGRANEQWYPPRVAKKKSGARPRTEERERRRQVEKLYEARLKLALLEPGGNPEQPLDVRSASVVESRAESEPCLRCNQPMRSVEHTTAQSANGLLRLVRLECRGCGARRELYLRIVGSYLN